jgi:hypothetical protein
MILYNENDGECQLIFKQKGGYGNHADKAQGDQ